MTPASRPPAPWVDLDNEGTFRERFGRSLRSFVSTTPSLPAGSPLGPVVEADMVRLALRRSRAVAWAGILVNLPLFYFNDIQFYQAGMFADPASMPLVRYLFAWRIVAVLLLAGYLVLDRRVRPRDGAIRPLHRWMATLFPGLFLMLGATFGSLFIFQQTTYSLYALTTLLVAVAIHPPNRAKWGYYLLTIPAMMLGAIGFPGGPAAILDVWLLFYVVLSLSFVLDRLTYTQLYRNVLAARMLAAQNDELEATVTELRQTRAQLVEAERQAERDRISRDLHDSVGAQLSSLLAGVELARLGQGTHGGPPTTLDEVEADAREAMQQLRETVWALRAESLTAGALAAQIRRFAEPRVRRAGMTLAVTVKEHSDTVLSPPQALNLYRIAQEAVQNAVKHSGGRTVRVTLARDKETLRLCVADDGQPSVPESRDGGAPGGFGLSSMRDRAEALGGVLVMDFDAGTSVEVAVPLAQATDA